MNTPVRLQAVSFVSVVPRGYRDGQRPYQSLYPARRLDVSRFVLSANAVYEESLGGPLSACEV